MYELFDYIFVRLYYRLFIRPQSAAKAAPEWIINLPDMTAAYRGPSKTQGNNPLADMTMTFYMAGDGEGGKVLCGALTTIPAKAQTTLDKMSPRRRKRFLRRLIEEGDCVFRTAWEQAAEK
jgi:hypothetical protein